MIILKKWWHKEKIKEKEKDKFKPIDKVKGAMKFLADIGTGIVSKNSNKKMDTLKTKKEKEVRYKILISFLKEFVNHFPFLYLLNFLLLYSFYIQTNFPKNPYL